MNTKRMNPQELNLQLAHFCGTQNYYEHRTIGQDKLLLTDGCHFLRENARCYWLFDLICSYQYQIGNVHFQNWKLKKTGSIGWIVSASDGEYNRLVKQNIPYSDFPLEEGIELFFVDGVVMLPWEY